MSFQWEEDDGVLPAGVTRLGRSQPENNRSYVMYHGTTRQAAQSIRATGFRQSTDGMLGPGVYLSRDLNKATRYPMRHPESDKVIIKVVVNVGRVIAINRQGHPRQKTWHDSRYGAVYDTAWVPPNCGMVSTGLEEDCVWDPNRIEIINIIEPRQTSSSAFNVLSKTAIVNFGIFFCVAFGVTVGFAAGNIAGVVVEVNGVADGVTVGVVVGVVVGVAALVLLAVLCRK